MPLKERVLKLDALSPEACFQRGWEHAKSAVFISGPVGPDSLLTASPEQVVRAVDQEANWFMGMAFGFTRPPVQKADEQQYLLRRTAFIVGFMIELGRLEQDAAAR